MNKKMYFHLFFSILLSFSTRWINTQNIWQKITYHKSRKTLEHIMSLIAQKKKGVYLRFGDGDVSLAMNRPDMLQKQSPSLCQEMREAFALHGNNILKCLVLTCPSVGLEPGMFPGKFASNDVLAANLLQEAQQVWGGPIKDVYSPVAMHYCATDDTDFALRFLRFLKSCKHTILVGNKNIPMHIKNTLFGSHCRFVKTLSTNAYLEMDRIESECKAILEKSTAYQVVILAMGCSGRALQKRLWKQFDNIFIFDFGSLMDALCGWDTRAWISLSKFDKDDFFNRLSSNIHVICTAALIEDQFQMRQQEYEKALTSLVQFGLHPYIFESVSEGNTFLENFSHHVAYTKTNDITLHNKGVNEARSMIEGIKYVDFLPDDMIVKVTGRYFFENDKFIKLIEQHPEIDVFVRRNNQNVTFTGCFAMRFRYLHQFLLQLDLENMENRMIGLEHEFGNYIQKLQASGANVVTVDHIHLTANIFGQGIPQITYW